MARFRDLVDAPAGSKFILQGNEALALGVVHSGFHAADGYPGTPSTEVIDKSLKYVQDKIKVGWSVNEAVAMGVGIGHSIAGADVIVTMKIPGVFQAGDPISTSAFFTGEAGALVIYAATDYVPSSTQHVIDVRYFLDSCRLPIIEPKNHQEMYNAPWYAAEISKKFNTPVVIVGSGILSHSEGLVVTREQQIVPMRQIPQNFNPWMTLPHLARVNFEKVMSQRIPQLTNWVENSDLITEETGTDNWGIILSGVANIIVREALKMLGKNPSILALGMTYPFPKERVKQFANKIKGKIFVFEDGDKYVQNKVQLLNIPVIGKEEYNIITEWSPEMVIEHLNKHLDLNYQIIKKAVDINPISRPPAICPGCPYRAFALTVDRLKKKKKISVAFGDIGCSTLLYFLNSLDTVCAMGSSDAMRQGFTISRPEMAAKTISIIGDSCECHSGMDATRNAIFRNTPGIKVILDNTVTAMTGGQPAPTSPANLAGITNRFNLKRAVEAEGARTVAVDAYDLKEVDRVLLEALELAEKGEFTTLILEGLCIQEATPQSKIKTLTRDYELCRKCFKCNICPGIEFDAERTPHYTNLCSNCGANKQVCLQRCPFGAIIPDTELNKTKAKMPVFEKVGEIVIPEIDANALPESLRVAIRGIGGQGNLFFGKVLSEVILRTPYSQSNIVKGDTHGMAQMGGPVISTFSCGKVYSPILSPSSVDVLIVMEISEILRAGFLELLKPNGTIIFNNFKALPVALKKEDYPDVEKLMAELKDYKVISIDANKIAYNLGDLTAKTANVVVLGLLSKIEPFNAIPSEVWLSAIMAISPNDAVKAANKMSFEAGRNEK